jgi:replicative DNA helicase
MMPRRLPHSPEAEMTFLGSQLLEPDRKLGNGLQHSHFALNEHGWLFAAIRQAQSAGIRFDAIAAEQWIVTDARFDGVGGKDYITKLLECAEGPINAEERAHFIIDLAEKRNLIDIAESLDTAAHAADRRDG